MVKMLTPGGIRHPNAGKGVISHPNFTAGQQLDRLPVATNSDADCFYIFLYDDEEKTKDGQMQFKKKSFGFQKRV